MTDFRREHEFTAACIDELHSLWDDLNRAIDRAINCTWSIEAEGLKERIQRFTKLVGPTPWEQVQLPLLENGIYQLVHAEIAVQAEVDMERVARTRASINARRDRMEEERQKRQRAVGQ